MRMTLLSPRTITQFGMWNVRTMYEAGRTAQVAAEMKQCCLAVPGMCENSRTRYEQIRLATGETLVNSGRAEKNAPYRDRVGTILLKEATEVLAEKTIKCVIS